MQASRPRCHALRRMAGKDGLWWCRRRSIAGFSGGRLLTRWVSLAITTALTLKHWVCWLTSIGKVAMSVLTKGLAMDFERQGRRQMAVTSIWPAVVRPIHPSIPA